MSTVDLVFQRLNQVEGDDRSPNSIMSPDTRSAVDKVFDTQLNADPGEDSFAAQILGQKDFPNEGLSDTAARFALARADTLPEKQAAFKRHFPDGELTTYPGADGLPELLFRTDPAEVFDRVDARALDRFEPVNDLVDFVGDMIGPTLAETALGASKKLAGSSPLGRATKMGLAAAGGGATQEAIEEFMGENQQALGDVALDILAEDFTGGALGDLGGQAIAKGLNMARGAGPEKINPLTRDALTAERELGLPPLRVDQVAEAPLVKRVAAQAAAINPVLKNSTDEQFTAARKVLTDRTSQATERTFVETLNLADKRARREIEAAAKTKSPNVNRESAGNAIQEGVRRYKADSQTNVVTPAYARAEALEPPQIDLTTVKGTADEISAGVQAPGAEGGVVDVQTRSGDLDALIADVQAVDATATPFEAIKELRSRAYDLSQPPPGGRFGNDQRLAKRVFDDLSDAIENPANANPEFQAAWREANRLARKRFDTIEQLNARGLVAEGADPERLFDAVVAPGRAGTLRQLKRDIPSAQFKKVREAFQTDLLSDPAKLASKLDSFDDETLSQLLTKPQRTAYRELADGLASLDSVGARNVVQRQTDDMAVMREFIDGNSTAGIAGMAALLKKQARSQGDKNLVNARQTLMNVIVDDASKLIAGEASEKTHGEAIRLSMKKYRQNGAINILTTEDQRVLQGVAAYLQKVRPKSDIAANLMVGSVASAVTDIASVGKSIGERGGGVKALVSELITQRAISKALTSPKFRALMLGRNKGVDTKDFAMVKTLGAILGTGATNTAADTTSVALPE